ncbi:hypothetical protein E1B28_006713 [Marasmius oreades]|uniref:Uncharacterized protein n=1 Tax=Marasmius oreades TaxID=181124 RepID=A0A9P7UWN3_9AGAR|nr:uncharacterized protein E1B28_006713 [Marasmius oreades]KAG7096032.1 hypothetical protein E1B28_006713 [Marasmius oreades]
MFRDFHHSRHEKKQNKRKTQLTPQGLPDSSVHPTLHYIEGGKGDPGTFLPPLGPQTSDFAAKLSLDPRIRISHGLNVHRVSRLKPPRGVSLEPFNVTVHSPDDIRLLLRRGVVWCYTCIGDFKLKRSTLKGSTYPALTIQAYPYVVPSDDIRLCLRRGVLWC